MSGPALRVLVVDDDPGVRYTLREILESEGLDVEEAADGAAALARSPLLLALMEGERTSDSSGSTDRPSERSHETIRSSPASEEAEPSTETIRTSPARTWR